MDDEHALNIVRQIFRNLKSKRSSSLSADREVAEPLFDAEQLYGIVGTNLKKGFDVREVRFVKFYLCLAGLQTLLENDLNCSGYCKNC